MPASPQVILHVRPDTFGDLIIFSSALRELLDAWPNARHIVLVRPGYESLAPLLPHALEWKVTTINPFRKDPSEARSELQVLWTELDQLAPDLIVGGTINRTWLEVAIAARYPRARRVALGHRDVDPLFVTALRLELGLDASQAFPEVVPADEGLLEWENNLRLVNHLTGAAPRGLRPVVQVPVPAQNQAARTLASLNLKPKEWVAVFPAGLANVQIKAWPTDRFGAIVAHLQRRGHPVLLLAHQSERSVLDDVSAAAVARGGQKPPQWLGTDGGFSDLVALLAQGKAYVGHDTGAMHAAAAAGVPTLGIFGGGHWPRFRPKGARSLSVVQPLPCFGCNWDCHFGDAPCVKLLSVETVCDAIDQLLADPSGTKDEVIEARDLPDATLRLIAAATATHRRLQADRLNRQHKIEELTHLGREKDVEIDALKQSAEDRKREMESIKAELEAECADKDVEIAELKRSAEDRKTEMESIKAELEAECADKDGEIAELKREADVKDTEIASIKEIANERERLIITQDGHIKHFQQAQQALQGRIAELEAEAARRQATLDDLQSQLSALPADATNWAQAFRAKDVHIGNLDAIIANLQAGISERDATLTNVHQGFYALESAKHFGKLLAEKEAVLQTLNSACIEREKVIRDLTLQRAGLGRVVQLWNAAKAHLRLKYTTPLNAWLFRKIVEEYWMQIGVLRHYEPRPIKWDRMPKPRQADDQLPQIAIVTPSYGQETFIESTLLSVLNQRYPRLLYAVQDGGSKDSSPAIIARYTDRLTHWESVRDKGQADAVRKGFAHLEPKLGPDDIMAWLNSDDLLAPRSLRTVGEYFARHPKVDVIYGHRIIIDPHDQEVGRWIMPRHDPRSLEWIDYIPQETMFWRKRAWDRVGGIDPSFQFALDWDILARFTQAGCRMVRLPYFLGCFRVHSEQKTSQAIHTTGAAEMARVRQRFHGANQDNQEQINRWARRIRYQGALTARLADLGIRL